MRNPMETRRRGPHRVLTLALLLAGLAAAGGCGKDKSTPPPPSPFITPRALPSDVVQNLEAGWKNQDIQEYSKLLAADFQFWFDPATRADYGGLPEFWTRREDSTGTGNLFASPQISNVHIELTYGADVADARVGHARWRKIVITDTELSVDKAPDGGGGEATTFVVDGDVQEFYLRKGFTEGDTLVGSATAREWFLVEWRDRGLYGSPTGRPGAARPTATQPFTWSSIKTLYR